MGYYCKFTLTYKLLPGFADEQEEFIKECKEKGIKIPKSILTSKEKSFLKDLSEDEYMRAAYDETRDSVKWYNYQESMKKLSDKYHDILLRLEIWGEETGDIRVCYALNGEIEEHDAIVTFPEPLFPNPEK